MIKLFTAIKNISRKRIFRLIAIISGAALLICYMGVTWFLTHSLLSFPNDASDKIATIISIFWLFCAFVIAIVIYVCWEQDQC